MFNKQLDEFASRHLTRRLTPIHSGVCPVVEMAGRQILLFASNDYLGLAMHPEVIQASVEATQRFGAGSGAARLVSGSLPPHQELETALAEFKGTEAALTYSSGYLANIGTIPALIGQGGLILADRLCHASLIDGCRLSAADFRIYRHSDMSHLKSRTSGPMRRRKRSPNRSQCAQTTHIDCLEQYSAGMSFKKLGPAKKHDGRLEGGSVQAVDEAPKLTLSPRVWVCKLIKYVKHLDRRTARHHPILGCQRTFFLPRMNCHTASREDQFNKAK